MAAQPSRRTRSSQPSRRRRPVRERAARGASVVGRRFTAEVGPWAHGGHCVVRVPLEEGTRVVFTRHALPGEEVVVEITEGTDGDRFWRGDAVVVLRASPDRVAAPCPYAHPGCSGGGPPPLSPLRRLGGVSGPVVDDLVCEAVPGDVPPGSGLGWRTRMQYVVVPGAPGQRGLRAHRSHQVVPIEECLIAAPAAVEPGPGVLAETVRDRTYGVDADGFWQVHPGAPAALVAAVFAHLQPREGERVLDLYAGVGLFAGFLGEAVGATGGVLAVEGSASACEHARRNLADLPHAAVETGPVDRVLARLTPSADLVVLDPPREGARRTVVEQVVAAGPRAVAYVACDPAALARDVASFASLGYDLTALRAFDLFPMTHHVECVALLEPPGRAVLTADLGTLPG